MPDESTPVTASQIKFGLSIFVSGCEHIQHELEMASYAIGEGNLRECNHHYLVAYQLVRYLQQMMDESREAGKSGKFQWDGK